METETHFDDILRHDTEGLRPSLTRINVNGYF